MWISDFTICCALLLGAPLPGRGGSEDYAFQDFLMEKLENYSTWLQSRHLDPTPFMKEVVDISQYDAWWNMTGEIWNHRMYNHSYIYQWYVHPVDLANSRFGVVLELGGLTITGIYKVNGTFHYDGTVYNPLSGYGKCNMTIHRNNSLDVPLLVLDFTNFGITSDGYVDLSVATVYRMLSFRAEDHTGNFEGLSAGDYVMAASERLTYNYDKGMNDKFPIYDYLETFLRQVFEQTSFADIIGSQQNQLNRR